MICKNCGKELPEGTKKCDSCGKKVKLKFKDLPKKEKIKRSIIGCAFLLLGAIFMIGDAIGGASRTADDSSKYISIVKNGALYAYSEQTVGNAFENFFAEPKWVSFTSDDGDIVVEFNGECTFNGEDVNCCIQFIVNKETEEFYTDYADIDGTPLSDSDIDDMYDVIYDE